MRQLEIITSADERRERLGHLEGVIRRGMQTFIEVGAALEEIRSRRLYEPDYDGFESYCQAEFGWTRRYADRNIRAARTAATLRPFGLDFENEAQAREMSRLAEDAEAAGRVWRKVGEANGGKHPSTALREAIDRELGLVPKPENLSAEEAEAVLSGYADVRQAVSESTKERHVHFSSESPEWYTPRHVLGRVVEALGAIDLDPCSEAERHVPTSEHFTRIEDGLSREWCGRVFVNPPYGRETVKWIQKLKEEYEAGRVSAAVVLVAARTDTAWFALLREFPRCFLRGRLSFSEHENSAAFPSVAIYLGDNMAAFVRAFGDMGDVYELAREDG